MLKQALFPLFLIASLSVSGCCGSLTQAPGDGESGTEPEQSDTTPVDGGLAGAPTTTFVRSSAGGGEVVSSETLKIYVSLSSLSYQQSSRGSQFAIGDPVHEAGLRRVLEEAE